MSIMGRVVVIMIAIAKKNVIYSSERLVSHFSSDAEYENGAKPHNWQILVNFEMHSNKVIFKSVECKISTKF